jgi:hypothetical protein
MPFGLKNRPSVFQRLTDKILGQYKWHVVLVYIDDIIINSTDYNQHMTGVSNVLEHVCIRNISHLGIVTAEGTIKAVMAFPKPCNVKFVQ